MTSDFMQMPSVTEDSRDHVLLRVEVEVLLMIITSSTIMNLLRHQAHASTLSVIPVTKGHGSK